MYKNGIDGVLNMFISASLHLGNDSLEFTAYDINQDNKSCFKGACNCLGHVIFYFISCLIHSEVVPLYRISFIPL